MYRGFSSSTANLAIRVRTFPSLSCISDMGLNAKRNHGGQVARGKQQLGGGWRMSQGIGGSVESTLVTRLFPASDLVVLGSSCDDDETSAA